ncbi:reversion-inducing cysteine-rich protein with Kazal motifs [Cephus cinctus]|uniref:Reversion-inducing cysteine-rich protein with Kazal motifs n=1 Tax=Cephus cinctus TaxID=211228 RepID=A0AAJ7FK61_CEPCN|nr:reversion-inducing cysteine-rich protein with Kazal motifs [Cephus cinctus]
MMGSTSIISWASIVVIVINFYPVIAQEMNCCSLAAGSCRNVCSKIPLVALGAEAEARKNATSRLLEFCSTELTNFWNCVNSTLREAAENEDWAGRGCCHLAQNPICRSTCALSGSRSDLKGVCRASDELEFSSCLERREDGETCCSGIANSTCRSVCKDIFHKPGKQSTLKLYSSKGCFHQIPKCLRAAAGAKNIDDPKQYLHCCDKATSPGCLVTCRETLHTATTDTDIFDVLSNKCSPVLPHLPMWSCFLNSTPAKSARLPLDLGKLSCCSRASTSSCKNLCWRAFQADWEQAWVQLDEECISLPIESELRRCLEDADETCEMGCSGLSYCVQYNDRPTALFRTCSPTADEAAKWEANHWSRGGIISGLAVPVRAAQSCPIETLRAAACLLQLRPCESRAHETRLCREDCLQLMTSCVDWSAIKGPHTATTLCSKLSVPRQDMPCVPFSVSSTFSTDTLPAEPALRPEEDITTPCRPNPCRKDQVCVLQSNNPQHMECLPGCMLGVMSKQVVPVGTWVQIPRVDKQGCLKICQCTSRGLEKCRMLNCFALNSCWIQNRFVAHRASFYLECNLCHCFEGEVTCSRRSCGEFRMPALPCDCPAHYVPVCGRLGVTFASACLAKCSGLSASEMEFGSCSSRDPCASNPCDSTEKCVKKVRVCLSPIHKPCRQYECVPLNCDLKEDEPVCDTENKQHKNSCAMVRIGASLGYRGPCLKDCSLRGPVCGINGEVYSSECAAWAERTVVDYPGPCIAVGLIGDKAKPRCGEAVQCPPLVQPYCIGVTPPGACCPVCGGAARLFYSRKQLDRIFYVMEEESDKDAVTLETLLVALGRQVQVAQCALRGMATPEGDVFVVSQPLPKKPSTLQMQACIQEMEKLVTRIQERSPRIVAEVPLGSLTKAETIYGYILNSATTPVLCNLVIMVPLLIINSFV